MSAQINLYHARFLKPRELLTLGKLALAALALYAVLGLTAGWAWQNAAAKRASAAAAEAELKSVKAQADAAMKAVAQRKPSPQVLAELQNVEAALLRRGEIARLLESGAVGSSSGFAEYLRGFARQVPPELWLTGFTIGSGGNDMELRGSMLNPAALPDYIRRLGAEKAFQGRSFAALTMDRAEPPVAAVAAPAGTNLAVSPAPTPGPMPIDFVLMPKLVAAKETPR